MSSRARIDTFRGRRQAPGLGRVWWKWEMNSCTQMDTVGSEMSNWAQKSLVEGGRRVVRHKRKWLGERRAIGLGRMWWR